MAYLKPQSPLQHKDGDYFYPLTTVDQVVMPDGSRLNSVFKHTVKKEVILLASDWSNATPYTQTITVDEYVDDLQVDANIIYSGDLSIDDGLNKAASCLSYIKKNGNEITFYCLKSQPEIDIPIEISYESLNGIATIGTSEEIDLDDELTAQAELIGELQEALQGKMGKEVLDFSIVGGTTQPTNPEENTIWIQTDNEENIVIEHWSFGVEEPVNPIDNMVWIVTDVSSSVKFDAIKDNDIQLHPKSAKQYVAGAFVNRQAQIWKSGQWNPFNDLPVEYRAVKYLESSRTQGINTGVDTKNGNVGIRIKFQLLRYDDMQFSYFYGSQKTSSTYSYFTSNISDNAWWVEYGQGYEFQPAVPVSKNAEYEIKHNYLNAKNYVVNGMEYNTNIANAPSSGYNIYLFGDNLNGDFDRGCRIRLYECEITEGTKVIRKFIPCYRLSDSVAGLYDTVTKIFFTNIGSGSFIVGGDV